MNNVKNEIILTNEMEDLIMEMEDIRDKLYDCIETVKCGKQLDSTQLSFLKMKGILK